MLINSYGKRKVMRPSKNQGHSTTPSTATDQLIPFFLVKHGETTPPWTLVTWCNFSFSEDHQPIQQPRSHPAPALRPAPARTTRRPGRPGDDWPVPSSLGLDKSKRSFEKRWGVKQIRDIHLHIYLMYNFCRIHLYNMCKLL